MATPVLSAEEYQLEDGGTLLNGDSALPFVDITRVQGLDAAPIREQITNREGIDGAWVDALYEAARPIILEGTAYAQVTGFETYMDELKANWAPRVGDVPLYIGTDAGVRAVYGKPQGVRYSKEQMRRLGCTEVQFILTCADPRIYTPDAVVTTLPDTVNMGGNRASHPVFELVGDLVDPSITLGGNTITLANGVSGGDTVTIDVYHRAVTDSSGASRRNDLTFSTDALWEHFVVQPGDNVFTTGGSGSGSIEFFARSAWR